MNKYCKNCNLNILKEEAMFCPNCGSPLIATAENNETTTEYECKQLSFCKRKMFSYTVYKETITDITLENQTMHFSQSIKKKFRKAHITETTFPIADIKDISIKTKMDFWDTLYAIIFIVLVFLTPLCLLLTALFLYRAYGKIIQVEINDGTNYIIPSELNTEDVQQLMSLVPKK